jgi:hypothetical protein
MLHVEVRVMPSKTTKQRSKSIYSVHPGVLTTQKWIAELTSKTGRSLERWIALVRKNGPQDEAARREWLKAEHGLGTNAAWWIAERSCGKGEEAGDPDAYLRAAERYVEAMYSGAKAALRPIHDRLIELGRELGSDVRVCPCETIVPLYRNHVFAQIKPSTRTRIDFGLSLGAERVPERLIDTGGLAKKDRITHRIAIGSVDEIDAEVERWARAAYERDA